MSLSIIYWDEFVVFPPVRSQRRDSITRHNTMKGAKTPPKKRFHIISWTQNEHNPGPLGFMVCLSNLCLNNCPVTNNTVALTN